MHFHFDTKKATQAAAVLLRFEDGKMELLRLLKLLYIADRESLAETGCSISLSRSTAMDCGPLSSDVYDLINGVRLDEGKWSEFIHTHGRNLTLQHDPGRNELSKYEIAKLNDVSERFDNVSTWDLVHWTHKFPEYIANKPPEYSSKPIPLGAILDALDLTASKQMIVSDLNEKMAFEKLLAGV